MARAVGAGTECWVWVVSESFLYRGVSCELQAAKCTLELGSMSRETTKSTRATMVRGLQTRSLRWPSCRGSFANVVLRQERLGRTDVYCKLSRRSEREGMRGRAERVNMIYSSSGPLVLAERPTPTPAPATMTSFDSRAGY